MSLIIFECLKKLLLLCFVVFCLIISFLFFVQNQQLLQQYSAENFLDKNFTVQPCSFYYNITVILNFNQMLTYNNNNTFKFAVVVPDGVRFENFTDGICRLIKLLNSNKKVLMAAAATVMPWKPVCTLSRNEWTVKMSYNYSRFVGGAEKVYDGNSSLCYPCDLLPDIFVVKMEEMLKYQDNVSSLIKLHKSAHLPFFTLFSGQSAYCPEIRLSTASIIEDFSCNNLSSRWDEAFAFVPQVSKILRLVSPSNLEYWIGCVWWKKAYVLGLPIHCSNFNRQYLFDYVEMFENKFRADYRLVFGTLLGALRDKDIIPWTFDVDIYLPIYDDDFDKNEWLKLPKYSSRRYSHLNKYFDPTKEKGRGFPMCPVLLTTLPMIADDVINANRNVLISKIFENPAGDTSYNSPEFKQFGFIDLFGNSSPTMQGKCSKKFMCPISSVVEIYKKNFKTTGCAEESLICEYGVGYMTKFYPESLGEWKTSFK